MGAKSFSGIKVLDLTRYLPGGYTTQVFADLGAEVIKVEDMGKGDFCRGDEPKINGVSYYFSALCRNKKSITINLKSADGKRIFHKLAQESDVIVENFRPGVTKRLGIDYAEIKKINPRIIYCSLSAFGQDDPRSLQAIHDVNLQALSGYLSLNGGKLSPLHLADVATGMAASQGIAIALYHREITGEGQSVDIPMFDSLVWWLSLLTSRYHFQGNSISAATIEYPALCYNIYETKDKGLLAFGMVEDKFWKIFCENTGMEDLIPKQFYRRQEDEEAWNRMESLVAGKTHAEWLEWLKDKDICITPVKSMGDAIEDILASKTGIMEYVEYPITGRILQTKLPYRMSGIDTPLQEATPPPVLGQHTGEILEKIGFSKEEIEAFSKQGVVGGV
ncbi:CaiB/BaiF CoA transferase family protein [Pelotomaculum propionicicum]|uniref:Acetyl-CoA:oxalate CoA-transferase n=1 Tax=Pelotomaculum propionicicum TaxID=258475 RepID=A0A4Y7RJJ2_9FIRM|nr:CaiB/BaiF CoA-transferase family protein [Pelotomaculum propionicicum]NLI12353.1 CoA transferase [Peptococcaceae bacterium]TEB08872.1 Acetyl-CoA:oxalate CoA-transferase [Pelotomaculum propionicicum]